VNLALTEDQRMIRDSAASFLADACDSAAVRRTLESESGVDAQLWKGIVEMGWCGTAVPESFGGLGLGPQEFVLILEQMGRHLAGGPFFATTALAANVLAEAGSPAARKQLLPQLAAGHLQATAVFDADVKARKAGKEWKLSGRLSGVLDGASAQLMLVGAKAPPTAIFGVRLDAKGVRRTPLATWDGTRRLADVELKNVVAERVDAGKGPGVARAQALARLYLAAEQLGGAQQCLDVTLRYIHERKQFGRPIASFQAVKHRCAQMMVKVEGLRSMVYGAAATAAGKASLDQVALECAGARALAADTFFHCAAEAIQLHGGVGFTWEFEPHLLFKRAQATSHALGTASALREQIAETLL